MSECVLNKEDWDRIVFALSHFSHNKEFKETLTRVLETMGSPPQPTE